MDMIIGTNIDIVIYRDIQMHMHIHINIHIYSYTYTNIYTYTYRYPYTFTYTYVYTYRPRGIRSHTLLHSHSIVEPFLTHIIHIHDITFSVYQ